MHLGRDNVFALFNNIQEFRFRGQSSNDRPCIAFRDRTVGFGRDKTVFLGRLPSDIQMDTHRSAHACLLDAGDCRRTAPRPPATRWKIRCVSSRSPARNVSTLLLTRWETGSNRVNRLAQGIGRTMASATEIVITTPLEVLTLGGKL